MTGLISPEEVDTITVDELADKSRLHSLKQCLNKSTVPMLLESDAEYLVMDFYDMGINFCTYENTMFATQANEFCQTALYRKYADKIGIGNLYDIATCLWYGYIVYPSILWATRMTGTILMGLILKENSIVRPLTRLSGLYLVKQIKEYMMNRTSSTLTAGDTRRI